jgi:RecA-family ATPase
VCANPALIVIDTLPRNTTADENSAQDIGIVINNIETYFKPLGAAVLIVHHSVHADKNRSRGSSAIRGAVDGEFSATKHDGLITLSTVKSKDFAASRPLTFSLRVAELDWLDDDWGSSYQRLS